MVLPHDGLLDADRYHGASSTSKLDGSDPHWVTHRAFLLG